MMSRPAIIIGLLLAFVVHWMMLLPPQHSRGTVPAEVAASIAMRELPEEAAVKTPLVEEPPPQPSPRSEPSRPAPVPPAQPLPPQDPIAPRPSTNLAPTAVPQRTTLQQQGDFSGKPDATRRPALRIDWGSPEHARGVVTAAGMRLVMLGTSGDIAGEVASTPVGWQRIDVASADLSGYSNRVRIVDTTPAFAPAASLCTGGERLAVLLPLALEHTLRTQQVRAAAEVGVESSRIRAFYGRFRIEGGRVAFDINGIERRTS